MGANMGQGEKAKVIVVDGEFFAVQVPYHRDFISEAQGRFQHLGGGKWTVNERALKSTDVETAEQQRRQEQKALLALVAKYFTIEE